jgi:hypothetical protein
VEKEIIKLQILYFLHHGKFYTIYRNKEGYTMTLKYANKLDMVSPAWFTVRFNNVIDGN